MTTTGQGWINPVSNSFLPIITSLSVSNSISGANTIIAILGSGFKPYSTVTFGQYNPIQIFISSGQINFYVPFSASYGSYPVQVYNAIAKSNIINYTIDDSIGFWKIDASGQITNTNIANPYIDSVKINGTLDVTGSVKSNGSTITSDYRIKDIIEPLNDSYSVDNLKPIKYLNKNTDKIEIGFIAHELQEVFPYLVTGEKDGKQMQTVNYIGIIGILVKEIQQLKAEVSELLSRSGSGSGSGSEST
jgi:hypothetical protein